jgi:Mrp family chromosome partitioning ATPase
VSGVVVVGRVGRTNRKLAATLREQLAQANAPTLGVVATSVPMPRHQSTRFGLHRLPGRAPLSGPTAA